MNAFECHIFGDLQQHKLKIWALGAFTRLQGIIGQGIRFWPRWEKKIPQVPTPQLRKLTGTEVHETALLKSYLTRRYCEPYSSTFECFNFGLMMMKVQNLGILSFGMLKINYPIGVVQGIAFTQDEKEKIPMAFKWKANILH